MKERKGQRKREREKERQREKRKTKTFKEGNKEKSQLQVKRNFSEGILHTHFKPKRVVSVN